MFHNIEIDKGQPIYIQIKNYFRTMIAKGMLQKGERLPSTRELSSLLKVSRNTVISAYESLVDDGFINIIEGKGAFVSDINISSGGGWVTEWESRINEYAREARDLDIVKQEAVWEKEMIPMSSISPEPELFPMEDFKRAFMNIISLEGYKILNYGYAQGYKPLLDYLTGYMESKGVNTEGKSVLITNGFTEAFEILISSLTKEGDPILCENPTHNTALKIMKLRKLDILGAHMDGGGISIQEVKRIIENNKVKLAYITPSYHNPTGITMPWERRIELYDILAGNDIPIIENGFNEELRYFGSHISPIAAIGGRGNGVIYTGSFSKILFPGLRLGWIVADTALIDYLESVKRSRNIHTSFLDQAILYEFFREGSFEKYIKKARRVYKQKYEAAIAAVRQNIPQAMLYGDGGLHIFIKHKGINSRNLLSECIKKGVIFTPGDIFYINDEGKDAFRLGFSRVRADDIEIGIKIISSTIENIRE
ncbi:MocR-like pyridoxine biosynthesis transcription factor PdxR [Lutispora saccharofermentans]|uniref:PLP-dependent aminotransferase family protein n=1 Tax=Lutispora saccharofermentans TaxID=3024236 RepID=A0ABT1NKG8_9FIRM|nr:PLP-dependent aminotransferase family protein [Lutispora saccharofermentans]MCQ1531079.1 PLP-dependent aminotransferase family protein [Lutispora saccharofermentans]